MKQVEGFFSVPYLIVNKQFEILYYNKEIEDIISLEHNFLKLIDEESIAKVQREVVPAKPKNKIEVNLTASPAKGDLNLVDLYIKWKNDLQAELMIVVKDNRIADVTASLGQLRSRLNNTNFKLLEEKEKLQDAINENNRLSAPFIEISASASLVPLFGDINEEKMFTIRDNLLESAHYADKEVVLVDLTAVGEIEQGGVIVFQDIVQSLSYMGLEIVVIGVRPEHAQRINELEMKIELRYLSSLQKAFQKYCN